MRRGLSRAKPFIPAVLVALALGVEGSVTPSAGALIVGALALGVFLTPARRRKRKKKPLAVEPHRNEAEMTILDVLPDPVLLVDSRRTVLAATKAAKDMIGAGMVGRDLSQALRQPQLLQAVSSSLQNGEAQHLETQFPGSLARTFDVHVLALNHEDSTRRRAMLVFHDVTERLKLEGMQSDFVANVSHELRTPLSALTGFIETLQGPAKNDPEAQERFLSIMEMEAWRMARLVDDLLSLSRVEVNEHVRPQGRVNLPRLLKAVRATLAQTAQERGNTIVLNEEDGLADVMGDEDQLVEVFNNLLANALKYGAANAAVEIRIAAVPRIADIGVPGVSVAIRNSGEGIAPEHIPRLTERFYRIDKGRSRAIGGTGLGLAIVKHIVNRHRGKLIIESAPGEGATFTVHLPEFKDA